MTTLAADFSGVAVRLSISRNSMIITRFDPHT